LEREEEGDGANWQLEKRKNLQEKGIKKNEDKTNFSESHPIGSGEGDSESLPPSYQRKKKKFFFRARKLEGGKWGCFFAASCPY